MIAEIIATGTELLLGKTLNVSTQYLSEQLSGLGIEVCYQITVGDNHERLKEVLTTAFSRSEIVFVTGGLGPTYDDLTREVVAEAAGISLVFDREQLRKIDDFFQGASPPEGSERQARFPEGCLILENTAGTAPGALIMGEPIIVFLPGPPQEMMTVFTEQVLERLKKLLGLRTRMWVRVLKIFGLQETQLERMIEDSWEEWQSHDLAQALYYSLLDQHVSLNMRLGVRDLPDKEAQTLLDQADQFWSRKLKDYVFARDEETHASVVGNMLGERGLTLATAESCTSGLLGGRITDVPGSSSYYQGGVISYSNQSKIDLLEVRGESLQSYGAVSDIVAREMARGARMALHSDLGLATTGIAGPEGGTPEKPVGLVYIALADPEGEEVLRCEIFGNRESVRDMAVETALNLLRQYLSKQKLKGDKGQ